MSRPLGLIPDGRVAGPVEVPRSKSIAQRALVAAGLSAGPFSLARLAEGDDAQHLFEALRAAGVELVQSGGEVTGVGRPPGPGAGWGSGAPETVLHVGESGTGARLVTAAAGLCGAVGARLVVDGAGSLLRRSSPALFAALRAAGVGLDERGARDGWPVRVAPIGPPSTLVLERPGSSQEVSALLLALAAWPDEQWLEVRGAIPSRPYVALTTAVLARFGVAVEEHAAGPETTTFRVPGPLVPPARFEVEPDASAAAVALAAGSLSGGAAVVHGLGPGSAQGDVRIVEHLRALGVDATATDAGLLARGTPTRGAHLDLAGEPDLAPVLAIVAAAAAAHSQAASVLTGLETLPGKESSRIEVLAAGLSRAGWTVVADARSLTIGPPTGELPPGPLVLDPHGDHRMAFAFALLGLVRPGILVSDPGVVAKSWPSFWDDLERAGARLVRD